MTEEILPQIGHHAQIELERKLKELSKSREVVRVLEWGSGTSTIYFTRWLKRENIPYEWVSLEYDRGWYEELLPELEDDPSTKLVLIEETGKTKSKEVTMDEYVEYPSTLGAKFDLIFVDGRKRRRCVLEAQGLLSEGGVVYLHDAWRPFYHPAFGAFRSSRFVYRSLWRGSLTKPTFLESITQSVNVFWYRGRGNVRYLLKKLIQALGVKKLWKED